MISTARTFHPGGVVPISRTADALEPGIWKATLPSVANIPLNAPGEDPAVCLVKPGDTVREGMVIGAAHGNGVPVHASIPGKVRGISTISVAGGEMSVVTIDLAGEFSHHTSASHGEQPSEFPAKEETIRLIRSMGVTESGRLEWNIAERIRIWAGQKQVQPRIVVAGFDPEPNLRTEEAILRSFAPEVLLGMRILLSLLPNAGLSFCTNARSRFAKRSLQQLAESAGLKVRFLHLLAKYPQHDENLLIEAALGRPLARDSDAAQQGILTIAASTLVLIARAVLVKRPVIERSFTVTGSAVKYPRVVTARIGITVAEVLQECGGVTGDIKKIVIGDSFRGRSVTDLSEPIERSTSGLLVLTEGDIHEAQETDCIQCGYCAQNCPADLEPMLLYKVLQLGKNDRARELGIADCTQCGICSSTCPARLPLSQAIARGMHANG